jgi:transcriptional regulator with GAF, ATPase, and Fis domain
MIVRDEGSQNGTFVNGALVEHKQLKPGDRIDIGSVRIYFEQMPREEEENDATWSGVDPDRLYQAPLPSESDRLERIQRIAGALNSELDLDRILNLIMDHVVELAQAERGFLVLMQEGKLTVPVARNFQKEDIMNPEVGFSRSIAERVAKGGEAIMTVDATSDDRFTSFASIHEIAPRSVLCMPFKEKTGQTVGVVYIDNRIARGVFGQDHLRTLQSFCDLAAGAIHRAQLTAELNRAHARLNAAYAELKNKFEEQGGKLQQMEEALRSRQDELETKYSYQHIIGESPSMRRIFKLLDKVVDSEEPVLIEGENGTGKELIARAIHYNGPRQKGNFVAENVAAIPANLIESELFGYVRGAFTGADRDKAGLFELADGGTLFLDEVGDMSPDLQKKLLRVLQEKEVRRVGDKRTRKVNVRIISATNRDLRVMTDEKEFREDLYYRLQVLAVPLPPLRERGDDVVLLAKCLVDEFNREFGKAVEGFSAGAMRLLTSHHWPGNVRELRNVLERAVLLAEGRTLSADDLRVIAPPEALDEGFRLPRGGLVFEDLERELVRQALERAGGNQTRAATLLGMSRDQIRYRLQKFDLEAQPAPEEETGGTTGRPA